jgi:hypothetical protein
LLHDFHRNIAAAMPELLRQLKAARDNIVHFEPKGELSKIAQYDETRPENNVVHAIGE